MRVLFWMMGCVLMGCQPPEDPVPAADQPGDTGDTAAPEPTLGLDSGWHDLAPLPGGPRQENPTVALGGEIVVLGGFDDRNGMLDTVEAYDPLTDSWRDLAGMPEPRHHINAAAVRGKLYVVGSLFDYGFDATPECWVYDPQTDAWDVIAPMPADTERGSSAVGVIGSKIYVAGGYDQAALAHFSAFDTQTDAWETLPDLPLALDHLIGAVVDDVFYAIGGREGKVFAVSGVVYAFDPAVGQWEERASMPTPRGGFAGAAAQGRIYVVGGEGSQDNGGMFAEVEAYDPAADTWEVLPDMEPARHGTAAAGLYGAMFLPGGATRLGLGATDLNQVFVP